MRHPWVSKYVGQKKWLCMDIIKCWWQFEVSIFKVISFYKICNGNFQKKIQGYCGAFMTAKWHKCRQWIFTLRYVTLVSVGFWIFNFVVRKINILGILGILWTTLISEIFLWTCPCLGQILANIEQPNLKFHNPTE